MTPPAGQGWTPLREVHLTARDRSVQQTLAGGRVFCVVVALGLLPFPWHEAHGGTFDLSGLLCAMTPDCHPFPGVAAPSSGWTRCTGLTHGAPAVPLLLVALVAVQAVAVTRPTFRAGIACAAVAEVLTVGVAWLKLVQFDHMFQQVEVLPAEHGFDALLLVLLVGGLLDLGMQPFLYVRSRRSRGGVSPPAG